MSPSHRDRPRLAGLLLVVILGSWTLGETNGGELVTARELLTNQARFDSRLVTLSGRTTAVRLSEGRVPGYTFLLDDRTQLITVVAPGAPICPPTQPVTVEGFFRASQGPGAGSGHVEAISVSCR